jgi:hypothetical protein
MIGRKGFVDGLLNLWLNINFIENALGIDFLE